MAGDAQSITDGKFERPVTSLSPEARQSSTITDSSIRR